MKTFSRNDIKVYVNIFTLEDCWKILEYTNRPKWAFGHGSNNFESNTPFWVMNLNNDTFFTTHLLNIIEEKRFKNIGKAIDALIVGNSAFVITQDKVLIYAFSSPKDVSLVGSINK